MTTKNKYSLVCFLFFLISFPIFADHIVSTTVTWNSGEYVLYCNKTTGDQWAEMKKHPSTKGWVMVPNYFPLDDYFKHTDLVYKIGRASCRERV